MPHLDDDWTESYGFPPSQLLDLLCERPPITAPFRRPGPRPDVQIRRARRGATVQPLLVSAARAVQRRSDYKVRYLPAPHHWAGS